LLVPSRRDVLSTEGTLPVALVGLGAIGREVASAVLDTPELRLVAVVDVDPQLIGKPLSALLNRAAGDLKVEEESAAALKRTAVACCSSSPARGSPPSSARSSEPSRPASM
jgi:glyceraldehyde-3-phosphate dehydrogenase/erythrose-4-phosphate dehydrogenase